MNERITIRELPKLVRIDLETHEKLKKLKRLKKKSMAQIIIDRVAQEFET